MKPVHRDNEMGFQAWLRSGELKHRAHTHHDAELNHVLCGWSEYLLGGRRFRMQAGQTYLFWASLPHQRVDAADGTQMGWVVLPVSWLWRWRMPMASAVALLQGEMLRDPDPQVDDARSIARWADMLQRDDAAWRQLAELEVEARIRRMMLLGFEGVQPASSPRLAGRAGRSAIDPVARVEAMAAFLTRHSHEQLSVADVARHVTLEPSYAMRQFRQAMGMTMIEYLTRQRVAEVKRRLMTSDRPLLTIAYDCGFGSASRFHEAFRRLTGTTPAAYRDSLRPHIHSPDR
mgnify:CR=1 FL=1